MTCLSRLLALVVGFGGYFSVFFVVGVAIKKNGGTGYTELLLLGLLLGLPLAFVPLILVERPRALRRKAEEKARAAQAAAEQAAAARKKAEVEDILGKYK